MLCRFVLLQIHHLCSNLAEAHTHTHWRIRIVFTNGKIGQTVPSQREWPARRTALQVAHRHPCSSWPHQQTHSEDSSPESSYTAKGMAMVIAMVMEVMAVVGGNYRENGERNDRDKDCDSVGDGDGDGNGDGGGDSDRRDADV